MEIRSGFILTASTSAMHSGMTARAAVSRSDSSAETPGTDAARTDAVARARPDMANTKTETETGSATAGRAAEAGGISNLKPEELRLLETLRQRDRAVRIHEQAHVAAGGVHVTRAASYSYQKGPDGRDYAVGGEVGIDTGAVSGDPEATLAKARTIRRAALAPADPSSQDLRVAAQAQAMETEALVELRQQARDQARVTPATADDASGATARGEGEGEGVDGVATSGGSTTVAGASMSGIVPGADTAASASMERSAERAAHPVGWTAARLDLNRRIDRLFAASPGILLSQYA